MEIKPTIENGKETVKLYGKIIDITGLKSFTHFGQKYVVKRDEAPIEDVEEVEEADTDTEDTPADEVEETHTNPTEEELLELGVSQEDIDKAAEDSVEVEETPAPEADKKPKDKKKAKK